MPSPSVTTVENFLGPELANFVRNQEGGHQLNPNSRSNIDLLRASMGAVFSGAPSILIPARGRPLAGMAADELVLLARSLLGCEIQLGLHTAQN